MKIAFRVDASVQIGTGHVMRCLTLAKGLHERGAECSFVSRDSEGDLNDLLRSQGFSVHALSPREDLLDRNDQPVPAHAHWLGISWRTDAQQTIEAIGDGVVDWLIVDHYGLDKHWESQLRPYTKKMMVIDDLADREHDCDLLLDQNLVADFETRYDQLIESSCARLLGPKYALLQPEYAELRSRTPPRSGPVRRIFVYFGGSDLYNLTELTISAFLSLQHPDLKLDVVINPRSPSADNVRAQVAGHANITLHENVPSLASLMAKADLAIGAGGATTWERCCLGLPTIVVTVADNQRPIAESLNKNGLICWVGDYQSVSIQTLLQAIDKELDGSSLHASSAACSDIVDGKGTDRVISALSLSSATPLKIRTAELADEKLLLDWANDPLVRGNSFNASPIQPDSHRQWFCSRLNNLAGCKLYIAETQDSLPIGQVRLERGEGEDWQIHYGLWVGARGKGFGATIVKLAVEKLREESPLAKVIGCVKPDNEPSKRVFQTLGFSVQQQGSLFIYTMDLRAIALEYRRAVTAEYSSYASMKPVQ